MTPSELKQNVEQAGHEPYFFSRETMKFFGDTMSNYGCRTAYIETRKENTNLTETTEVWELWRKRAVKHGLKSSAYFHKDTFENVFKVR